MYYIETFRRLCDYVDSIRRIHKQKQSYTVIVQYRKYFLDFSDTDTEEETTNKQN